MITNARILTTLAPRPPDAFGKPSWALPVTVNVPCLLDVISLAQQVAMQSVLRDATHKVIVEPQGGFDPFQIATGWRMFVDRSLNNTQTYGLLVEHVRQISGGLAYCEFYCRQVPVTVVLASVEGGTP